MVVGPLLQVAEVGGVLGLVLEELVDELDARDAVGLLGDLGEVEVVDLVLAKRALCSDHSASEILKSPILPAFGLPLRSAARPNPGRRPRPRAAAPASEPLTKARRFNCESDIGAFSARGRVIWDVRRSQSMGPYPPGQRPGIRGIRLFGRPRVGPFQVEGDRRFDGQRQRNAGDLLADNHAPPPDRQQPSPRCRRFPDAVAHRRWRRAGGLLDAQRLRQPIREREADRAGMDVDEDEVHAVEQITQVSREIRIPRRRPILVPGRDQFHGRDEPPSRSTMSVMLGSIVATATSTSGSSPSPGQMAFAPGAALSSPRTWKSGRLPGEPTERAGAVPRWA